MSSSGKFPDWSVFQEREVPTMVEVTSPSSALSALLESRLEDIKAVKQHVAPSDGTELDILAQQAVYSTELAMLLDFYKLPLEAAKFDEAYDALRIVKDKMQDALKNAGLEIMDLQGKSFDEVPEYVDIIGWRHQAAFTAEVVIEVLEPVVLCDGLVMRRGSIVMGAPLEQKLTNTEMIHSER